VLGVSEKLPRRREAKAHRVHPNERGVRPAGDGQHDGARVYEAYGEIVEAGIQIGVRTPVGRAWHGFEAMS
jgi:hypothetical protein